MLFYEGRRQRPATPKSPFLPSSATMDTLLQTGSGGLLFLYVNLYSLQMSFFLSAKYCDQWSLDLEVFGEALTIFIYL